MLSVVIPAYNIEKYISKAVESVLNQSFTNFELILVNDGSTDKTPAILEKYKAKDSRITLLHQENSGISAARNRGLENATGEYIYFMDGDDWIEPELFLHISEQIDKHQCDVVSFSMNVYDVKYPGKDVKQYGNFPEIPVPIPGEDFFTMLMENEIYSPVVYLHAIKHSFLKKTGITFKEGFEHEDDIFTLPVLCQAERMVSTSKILYQHIVRQDSHSAPKRVIKSVRGCVCAFQTYQLFIDTFGERLHQETVCAIQQRMKELAHISLRVLHRMQKEGETDLQIENFLSKKEIRQLGVWITLHQHLPGLYRFLKKVRGFKANKLYKWHKPFMQSKIRENFTLPEISAEGKPG